MYIIISRSFAKVCNLLTLARNVFHPRFWNSVENLSVHIAGGKVTQSVDTQVKCIAYLLLKLVRTFLLPCNPCLSEIEQWANISVKGIIYLYPDLCLCDPYLHFSMQFLDSNVACVALMNHFLAFSYKINLWRCWWWIKIATNLYISCIILYVKFDDENRDANIYGV